VLKVLVIEDNPQTVDTVTLCFDLKWPGAEVVSTPEGMKGLEIAERESPDLVILDMGLPDIDGIDVLRRLRTFSDVPVVILTVRDSEMDISKGLEFGASAVRGRLDIDFLTQEVSVDDELLGLTHRATVDFISRVKAALRGCQEHETYSDERSAFMRKLSIDFATQEISVDNELLGLMHGATVGFISRVYRLFVETLTRQGSMERPAVPRWMVWRDLFAYTRSLCRRWLEGVKYRFVR